MGGFKLLQKIEKKKLKKSNEQKASPNDGSGKKKAMRPPAPAEVVKPGKGKKQMQMEDASVKKRKIDRMVTQEDILDEEAFAAVSETQNGHGLKKKKKIKQQEKPSEGQNYEEVLQNIKKEPVTPRRMLQKPDYSGETFQEPVEESDDDSEEGETEDGNEVFLTESPPEHADDIKEIVQQGGKALECMKEYLRKEKAESLFKDEVNRFCMVIDAHKVPTLDNSFFKIGLPYSVHHENADILLVIQDDHKGEDYQEPELKAALFKQKLLMEYGIKIREVITMRQLAEEYKTFEAKRKLIMRVDGILVQKSIIKYTYTLFGRETHRRNKLPIAVNFANGRDIGVGIRRALRKVMLSINMKDNQTSIVIGNDELTKEQLQGNINNVCNWLARKWPGGWVNVAKLYVTCGTKLPIIPIYISFGTRNQVTRSVIITRKRPEAVEDELATNSQAKRVRVFPDGTINVVQVKEEKDDES